MKPASAWRWPAGVAASTGAGALTGFAEGFLGAGVGHRIQAAVFDAGLLAMLGLLVGTAMTAFLFLVLPKDPLGRVRAYLADLRGDGPRSAAVFARSAALQTAAIAWLAVTFHAAKASREVFHHMGLAATLLTVALPLFALALWHTAISISRPLGRLLGSLVPPRPAYLLAAFSPLLLPLLLAIMVATSPADGSGPLGFLGLLKRDELEISFMALALPSIIACAASVLLITGSSARAAVVTSFALAGLGIAAFLGSATGLQSNPAAAYSIERETGMGSLVLAGARRIFDADGDGAASLFGGGDCDDGDPDRWPGAVDVPGNGIDEDCSGRDAEKIALEPPPAKPGGEAALSLPDDLSLLLLSVDAMRWDLGFAGYDRQISPNIDALASEGIVFERSYALSSFTGRSIGPMLIGRYPSECYCDARHLSRYHQENDFLAEILSRGGVATSAVQAFPYFRKSGLEQGFSEWNLAMEPGEKGFEQKSTGDRITAGLIEALEDEEFTGGRFFLWGHYMEPHKAYVPHGGLDFGERGRDRYDGEVAYADRQIGIVLEKLKERGLEGRTVVVVTSDHGEAFGEHDIHFHGRRLWEEVVRVPWIWSVPGLEPRRVRSRVSHIDLVATACDLLGVEPPEGVKGASLVPMMTGAEEGDRRIYIEQPLGEYMPPMYALIDGGHKLIHSITGNRYQLFDLDADPGEESDLAPSSPEKLDEMKTIYQGIRGSLERNAEIWKPSP